MRRLRTERGQALVVTALTMVAILLMAALSIDVATWYQHHHRAQVAADAASLAAANCLAHPNTGPTPQCTSTSDTTHAAQVATTMAADNGVTIAASQVTFNLSAGTVSVSDSATAPTLFAGIGGIGSSVQSSRAIADFKPAVSQTTSTSSTTDAPASCSGDCGAIFAGGSCSSGAGVTLSSISGTINGAVISDGNLSLSSVSGSIKGTDNYGPSSNGCSSGSYSASSISGSVPTPTQLSSNLPYPEDWRSGGNETVPACTLTASSGTAGTYKYNNGTVTITVTSTNITISGSSAIPAGVYCAPNGTVKLSSYSGGASNITLIGQAVTFSSVSGGPLSPCTSSQNSSCPSSNVLLMYMTGGGTLNLGSLSGAINGTLFAPSATISATSISGGTGFIEGNSVSVSSLSGYVGNGPSNIASGDGGGTFTTTTTIPASPAVDALLQ